MSEQKYVYIVAMVRTSHNEAEWLEAQDKRVDEETWQELNKEGNKATKLIWHTNQLARAFDDPVQAASYAMEQDWYPFTVERFPFGESPN